MSTFYAPSSELYHYGILGMKWGIRKANSDPGRDRKREKMQTKYDKSVAKGQNRKSNRLMRKINSYDDKKLKSRQRDIEELNAARDKTRSADKQIQEKYRMSDQDLFESHIGGHLISDISKSSFNKTVRELRGELKGDLEFNRVIRQQISEDIDRIKKTPLNRFTDEEHSRLRSGRSWVNKRK